MLRLWTLLSNHQLLAWMDDVEAQVLKIEGTSWSLHKYGGLQFNYLGKEIGHLHSNGLLDVLYSRTVKDKLKMDGRIQDHHVFANSGWISFYLEHPADVSYANELLLIAMQCVELKGVKRPSWD